MNLKLSGDRLLGWTVCIVLTLYCSIGFPTEALAPRSTLPGFQIKMPNSPEINSYLGLKRAKTFSLSQVQAKFLVVEFFDVFCPVCQGNAPSVNRLFEFIQEDKELKKKTKMLGIALEGKSGDLAVYKQGFKVEFPLFSDDDNEIKTLSKVKYVPLLIIVDKNGKILMSHAGQIKDLDPFLAELRKLSKAF